MPHRQHSTRAGVGADKARSVLKHPHDHSRGVMGHGGTGLVTLNDGDHKWATVLHPYDTISVPAGAWRTFTALDDEAQMLVVNSGDGRVRLEWPAETLRHAEDKGHAADAAGYVASWNVVRYSTIYD